MENSSAKNLWDKFLDTQLAFNLIKTPAVIQFGDNEKDTNFFIDLVLKNKKKATSWSLLGIQNRKETLPKLGDYMILTDWNKNAKCIIKITSVTLKPFFSISEDFAKLEGLETPSLAFWKKYQWDFFSRELAAYKRFPSESMIVVCVTFEKVFS